MKKENIKEDMISPADSPGFAPVNLEGPGQTHQTPAGIPSDMDTFSLTGPSKTNSKSNGKKPKEKKDENEEYNNTNKVLNFEEFMKKGSLD